MQYKKLEGIILKKQNYKEADQILTIWTREAGKIRCLARGVRLAKSKLVYSLADLSWVSIQITGRNFPTLIGATVVQQFKTITEDLKKMAIGFYAAELMLKMTADENPNDQAFEILADFLTDLDSHDYSLKYHPLLESFSLRLLDTLGFKIPQNIDPTKVLQMDSDEVDLAHRKINQFIEYIIERNIKSEPFLISI